MNIHGISMDLDNLLQKKKIHSTLLLPEGTKDAAIADDICYMKDDLTVSQKDINLLCLLAFQTE